MINDFFIRGQEEAKSLPSLESAPHSVDTIASRRLQTALAAYDRLGVKGSSEKDVVSATRFTVAGASVDSSRQSIRNQLVPVASPADKRCALVLASLSAARLSVFTRALLERLVGGWVRCMMFRRPTAVCFAKVYKAIMTLRSKLPLRMLLSPFREVSPTSWSSAASCQGRFSADGSFF